MTLIEFLHPVKSGPRKDVVLATLYYFKRYKDQPHMTAAEIKTAMRQAKVPRARDWNVNAVINQSAPHVHSTGAKENGAFLFELTGTGEQYIRDKVGAPVEPAAANDTASLEALAAKVTDDIVRGYIEEAILCLKVGALRAAVVFLWTGAIRTIQDAALAKDAALLKGNKTLNPAIQKYDPKARTVSKIEDFAYVKDKVLLLACGDGGTGMFDKGERGTLEDALDLRNRCGHPTKYKPGSAKTASFIEDVVGIVWK